MNGQSLLVLFVCVCALGSSVGALERISIDAIQGRSFLRHSSCGASSVTFTESSSVLVIPADEHCAAMPASVVVVPCKDPIQDMSRIAEEQCVVVIHEHTRSAEVDEYDIPPIPFAGATAYRVPLSNGDYGERSITLHASLLWSESQEESGICLSGGFHRITAYLAKCNAPMERLSSITTLTLGVGAPQSLMPPSALEQLERKSEAMWQQREHEHNVVAEYSDLYNAHRLHADLFQWDEERMITAEAIEARKSGCWAELLYIVTGNEVYGSIPLLSEWFCATLMEEVAHFEASGIDIRRPNSMNNYGVVLRDLGMGEVIDEIVSLYLTPLATELFPHWGGASIDSSHVFFIEYDYEDKDRELAKHMDQSEVTFNMCIGGGFTGGELKVHGMRDIAIPQTGAGDGYNNVIEQHVGSVLVHAGQHWHQAMPLTSGRRFNLVWWLRSSQFHQSVFERFVDEHSNNTRRERFESTEFALPRFEL